MSIPTIWSDDDEQLILAERQARLKTGDPKAEFGVQKVGVSVVPQTVIMDVALALTEGARKYGRHNYRVNPALASIYYDAARRHLDSWWEGEDIDKDSGLSHITKALASLFVLRDAMMQDNMSDDRPPASREGWMNDVNTRMKQLVQKYPTSKPPAINYEKRFKE